MSNLRFKVLQEAFAKKPLPVHPPAGMASDYYGSHVFGRKQMARYLSAETFRAFCNVLDNGAPFNREIANNVAVGIAPAASVRPCVGAGAKGGATRKNAINKKK